jgi:cell wall-associated NlpC family hydrolase
VRGGRYQRRHHRPLGWWRQLVAGAAAAMAVAVVGSIAAIPSSSVVTATAATLPAVPSLPTDPVSNSAAAAQAKVLQAKVAALQIQAEQASERYDAAQSRLGALVVQERAAQEQTSTVQAAASTDENTAAQRARALYMSGGTVGLYATVLGSNNPDQIAAGLHDLQALAENDARAISSADRSTSAVEQTQNSLSALLAQQDQLTAQVSDAATAVQQSLATQQAALDGANAQVVAAERAYQAQLDAAAAAAAAAALQQAEANAIAAGLATHAGPAALAAITAAATQLGKPYVYGGSGPDSWDCSGLTQWAYGQVGVDLPRTAAEQYAAVPLKVPLGQLVPGDLLFWATDITDPSTIHHVAIYLGGGMMLAAPHTGLDVQVQPVYLDGYIGAVRPTA